ncbi:MAG: hypothetical protein ABSC46_00715 [Candidatus Limnocylindrales bacterium]
MTARVSARRSAGGTAHQEATLRRRAFGFGGTGSALQTALAVAGPIVTAVAGWGRMDPVAFAAAVLVPAPVLLAVLAFGGRSRWAAQEVLAWLDSATVPVVMASADEAGLDDPAAAPAERPAHFAYRAAVEAVSRGLDGLAVLAAARPDTGRLGPYPTLKLWLIRLRFSIASALFGAWLLAAIAVAMATAGGVVWF